MPPHSLGATLAAAYSPARGGLGHFLSRRLQLALSDPLLGFALSAVPVTLFWEIAKILHRGPFADWTDWVMGLYHFVVVLSVVARRLSAILSGLRE